MPACPQPLQAAPTDQRQRRRHLHVAAAALPSSQPASSSATAMQAQSGDPAQQAEYERLMAGDAFSELVQMAVAADPSLAGSAQSAAASAAGPSPQGLPLSNKPYWLRQKAAQGERYDYLKAQVRPLHMVGSLVQPAATHGPVSKPLAICVLRMRGPSCIHCKPVMRWSAVVRHVGPADPHCLSRCTCSVRGLGTWPACMSIRHARYAPGACQRHAEHRLIIYAVLSPSASRPPDGRPAAGHSVRGGAVPQHRRVLERRQRGHWHRHHHAAGRHVHARVPLLRGQHLAKAAAAGPAGAGAHGAGGRGHRTCAGGAGLCRPGAHTPDPFTTTAIPPLSRPCCLVRRRWLTGAWAMWC